MLGGYRDNYYKAYLTEGGSATHIFCMLVVYLIASLPFYLAFGGSSTLLFILDFWLEAQNRQMTVQYNYTGLYAAEVNWMDGTTPTQDYFSNIPNSGITQPTARQLTITNDDQPQKSLLKATLGSYTGDDVLSVNLLLYYDIHVEDIGKTVTKALVLTAEGNFVSGQMSGVLQLNSYHPINAMGTNVVSNTPPEFPLLASQFTYADLLSYALTSTDTLLTHPTTDLTTSTANPSSRTLTVSLKRRL